MLATPQQREIKRGNKFHLQALSLALGALLLIYPLIITNAEENEGLILREKVVARISGIAAKLDGVMGLAVKDLTTGEEFLLNHNLVFPQGSSIKVAILLEVFKQAKEGKFSLQDRLWLEKKDKVGGSGILKELGNHTVSLTIKDIAILMILLSDNTATNILIDLVGMENVNRTLSELGLTETRLQRKMMDYRAAAEERENISTPMEMLKLLEFIYRSEVLDPSSCDAILDILKRRKSGSIRQLLPSGIEVAHKPGGIEGVACDIGVVYLPHRPYIICAMTNYLINGEEGSKAIAEVSRLVYDYFWRLSLSTRYGRRIPPSLLPKK